MRKAPIYLFLMVFIIILSSCSFHDKETSLADNKVPHLVGGRCSYKNITGICSLKGISGTKVVFKFRPANENIGKIGFLDDVNNYVDSRVFEQEAKLINLDCLKGKQINQSSMIGCGLVQDNSFDCTMSIIIKGTCTPVMFSFH